LLYLKNSSVPGKVFITNSLSRIGLGKERKGDVWGKWKRGRIKRSAEGRGRGVERERGNRSGRGGTK